MNLKPITFAALLAAPVYGAVAQAPQSSEQSEGHRGWFLKAAGALTSVAVFSSMIHSDAPGASAFGHSQSELHAGLPTPGGAKNPPQGDGNNGNNGNTDNNGNTGDHDNNGNPTPGIPRGPEMSNGGDDDIVTTTPEPGTAALLATGLVGLAGMVRRRPRA